MSNSINRLSNRLSNRRKQCLKGLTLVEMAIVIAAFGIISVGVFALSSSMVSMHAGIAEERFKTVLQTVLNEFYSDNIHANGTIQLIGSSTPATFTIAPSLFSSYKSVGSGDLDFSHDGSGNRWFYVGCSTTGSVTHPQIVNTPNAAANPNALFYCDIIGYTTNNNTQIPLGSLGSQTIQNWENRVGNLSTVSDFVVVRGAPVVNQIVNESWADIVKTRAAMEQYYTQQYQKNRELGVRVSRFSNLPLAYVNRHLYDIESIFRNTVADGVNDFDPAAVYALGLIDKDVSTVLGEMLIDNSSNDVRHPENATPAKARPPYTARIWYELCKNPDCVNNDDVIMEGIASSGSP